jgi:hypothetical protein
MAILTFVLGAILFAAGGYSLFISVDLVPTEMGQVYALSGVILLSVSFAVWAVAALIYRLDRIFVSTREPRPAPSENSAPSEGAAPDKTAPPKPEIVARYSADGAIYALFSNGAIEAETPDGALSFASMDEFKTYIAARKT